MLKSYFHLGLFLHHHQCDVPFRMHYVLQGCHSPHSFLLHDVPFRMHHVLQRCHSLLVFLLHDMPFRMHHVLQGCHLLLVQTHPSFRTYDMEIFCTLMEKHFHTIFNTYFKHKRKNTITCCSNVPSLVVHPCSLIWTPNVTIANHHVLCVSRIPPQTKEPK
jgi:hypothetical protein